MPRFTPISRVDHADLRYAPDGRWDHARAAAAAPICLDELAQLVGETPLAFVAHGEDQAICVSLLGLSAGMSAMVAADGSWRGSYIPATLRGHPFALMAEADGRNVLCVDLDAPTITRGGGGAPILAEGEPTPPIAGVARFLALAAASAERARRAASELRRAGVLTPWEVGDGQNGQAAALPGFAGLLRLDEAALAALPADSLAALRDVGGLMLGYAHLFSRARLPRLIELSRTQRAGAEAAAAPSDLRTLEFSF